MKRKEILTTTHDNETTYLHRYDEFGKISWIVTWWIANGIASGAERYRTKKEAKQAIKDAIELLPGVHTWIEGETERQIVIE